MGKPLRVLIVEDSEDDALLLLHDLRRGGYDPQFERVETAEAMQAALTNQIWDVVLSDYSLPQFDAPSALAMLQGMALDIPFIISSGTIGEDVAVASLKAGAHDFVVKHSNARLIPAIERELRDAESRRRRRKAEAELSRKSLFIEVLQEIAVAANEATTTDGILQFAVDKVCAFMGWPVGHVYVSDPRTGEFMSGRVWHLDNPDLFGPFLEVTEATRLPPHTGLIGQVVDRRQTVWIVDFTQDGEFFTRAAAAITCGLRGALAFPVLAGAEIVAILEFFTDEIVEIDQLLLDVTANIGTQLGQVFERQNNEAALRRYNERLQILHRIDRAILTMQAPEEIAEFILSFIQQQIFAFHASVTLFDFAAEEAQVLMAYSQQTKALPTGAHFSLAVFPPHALELLRTGHRYSVDDLRELPQTDPTVQTLQAEGLRAWVWIPLLAQNTLIGTLNLGSNKQAAFTTEQLEIAHEVADQLAIGIQQARYQDRIKRHNAELE
ncbi:MAG: GAF domain-containing protein, partial [Anaerolineae bacterium]|nr:GAF domain-containing protein [Anaerolineae bacterium]